MEKTFLQALEELKKIILRAESSNWLSLKEVCQYTNLSESTVRRAVKSGNLKCSRATGKLLFRRNWVDEFLTGSDHV